MANSAYYTAWQMTQNMDLMMRVAASAQQEAAAAQVPDFNPEEWARVHRWEWATQADWVAAVNGAMASGITAWGSNGAVVTDQMILSWVQPHVTA